MLGRGVGLPTRGSGGFTAVPTDRETDVDTPADPDGLFCVNTFDGPETR